MGPNDVLKSPIENHKIIVHSDVTGMHRDNNYSPSLHLF